MKTATLLLAFVISQSACVTPVRGPSVQAEVVEGALGRGLDSLMNGFLQEGYSGADAAAGG